MLELSEDQLRNAVSALRASRGSETEAAKLLKLSRSTYQHHLKKARSKGMLVDDVADDGIELPDFPADDIPVERIIDQLAERYEKREASYDAHTWFPVTVKDDKPIGVVWFGDPHCDDPGCNWRELKEHVAICKKTQGLYGANIGDTTNNWSGRLAKLYANQDTSVKTARRLAEWFMLGSGVRWLVWLLGNHDAWGDGADILTRMGSQFGTQHVVMHDWEARFRLVFPNGWEPRIFAAHNFAGSSQWNPLHGPMKEGQMGADANLYVAGHLHNWATFQFENAARGTFQTFVRVRGYKRFDDYSRRLGKHDQSSGSSILTIFNTKARSIEIFVDIARGADYLTWLRKRA
jgi:biotin operon repressor